MIPATTHAPSELELPLLDTQLGIYLAEQCAPIGNTYSVAHYLELHGALQPALLLRAIQIGLAEVDTLQLRLNCDHQPPLQWLSLKHSTTPSLEIEYNDMRQQPDPVAAALALMQADLAQPLLADGVDPLYTHQLLRVGEQQWYWYQRYHHICVDGYSFAAISQRIAQLYNALCQQQPLPPCPWHSFAEVVAEQQTYQRSSAYSRDQQFWQHYVSQLASPLSLSTRSPSTLASANVDVLRARCVLDETNYALFSTISHALRLTAAELASAALLAYLQRMSGSHAVVVGVPFMRRMGSAALYAGGATVNVLPVQMTIEPELNLKQLALRFSSELRRVRQHQRYAAEQIQRDAGQQQALYRVMLNLKLYPHTPPLSGVEVHNQMLAAGPIDDLELALWPDGATLVLELSGHPQRYSQQELQLHAERTRAWLHSMAAQPDTPLAQLAISSPAEQAYLARCGRGPTLSLPPQWNSVLDSLAEQVRRQPLACALRTSQQQLSFAELAEQVAQLARALVDHGVGSGDLVALALPRSLDSVVAILATLTAGAAYLPLDLAYPPSRLALMLQDAQPRLVLSTGDAGLSTDYPILRLDQLTLAHYASTEFTDAERRQPLNPLQLAYVIYTSGSTGTPKGVMVTHGGLLNLLNSHRVGVYGETLQRLAGRPLRALHSTSLAFDASWEQLIWLLLGQTLYLCSDEQRHDAQALVELVQREQIDALDLPPALAQQMLDCGLLEHSHQPSLLLIGSEAIPTSLWQQLRQHPTLRVENCYGPTEYTVDSLSADLTLDDQPLIGRPIANTQVYVLDGQLQPVPIGVIGELYIAGAGLARGYLGRPELTANRFIANPWSHGERMYRSGDLVRWRPDGQLEFIGRSDQQIKRRGFRIELGEIEQALCNLTPVHSALVRVEASTQRLLAYCTVHPEHTATAEFAATLLAQLADCLPDYMLPNALQVLDAWPLTVNGKIDRQALPLITPTPAAITRTPSSPAELLLCQSIANVLALPTVDAEADFFSLGGDSISAMSLSSALRRAGWVLRPSEIFAQRSIARMAKQLQPLHNSSTAYSEITGSLPATPIMRWFAEHYGLNSRYSHALLITLPAATCLTHIHSGLQALQRAHPVLRAQLVAQQLQVMPTSQAHLALRAVNCPAEADWPNWLDQLFLATSAALSANILWQALRIQRGEQCYLLLVLHHLLVDGVTWRILLPELQSAVTAASAGRQALIAREDYSLTHWVQCLHEQVPARRSEFAYWQRILHTPAATWGELQPQRDTYAHAAHQRWLLDSALSRALLQQLPHAYQAQVDELLLTALAIALRPLCQSRPVRIALESHGRPARYDLSRTVGWLTAEYPLLLDLTTDQPLAALRMVKQCLRETPDRGLGYGVLRYFDPELGPVLAALETQQRPSLLFNYLGRLTATTAEWQPCSVAGQFADGLAVDVAADAPLLYPLELNVLVQETATGPCLAWHYRWTPNLLTQAQLEQLQQRLTQVLQQLWQFAQQQPLQAAATLVAADTLAEAGQTLSCEQLAQLEQRYGALSAVLPVLPLQQGLLFHAQLGESASRYNSTTRLDFSGPLCRSRLQTALQALLIRHPQLAAQFDSDTHHSAVQCLPLQLPTWPWSECDLSSLSRAQQASELWRLEQAELQREFPLGTRAPLLHLLWVTLGAQQHCVFISAHHLVVDGWSTPLLLHDLLHAYGQQALAATRVSYAQVVRALSERNLQPARQYWQTALTDVQPCVLFPESVGETQVQELEILVPPALERALTALCREQGLTLNSVMQGAWAALLALYSGRDEVVFGSPVSGRFSPIEGIDEHIGLFSNTLPVRVRLQPQLPLLAQLAALQTQQIEALEHDSVGLGEIQRLAGVSPLFDTLLVVENYPEQSQLYPGDAQGVRLEALRNRGYTHYPLTALVLPGPQLRILLEYRTVVRTPQRLAQHLLQLLEHLVHSPTTVWASYDPLTDEERDFLASINATEQPIPATTLDALLQRQAQLSPLAPALADTEQRLNYQQLRWQVSALAQRLQQAGVGIGDVVAVALPRSVRLTIALHAVIEAGAAYLPLDIGYPDQRLAYMLSDAQPRVLITSSELAERFSASHTTLCLFDQLSELDSAPLCTPVALQAQHAAYLLYTSGSTGRPKGVLVSHQAIINRLLWMQQQYPLTAADVVLQKTPCSFDVSVWEFFWPLIVGAQLFMAPPEAHRDPEQLLQLIEQQRISTLHFVPSMLAAWLTHLDSLATSLGRMPSLRQVFCSGEALALELADAYAQHSSAPLHNLYGPTEAAVDVSYKPAAERDAGTALAASVPIGRPVWNTQLRILDQHLRPVPLGVAGELYLCGIQLAEGYLGRPDLTATRFVADPYCSGQRMYRTGDIARWLPTGDVEYLGRSDDQLKIRGQRIELGEIEAALLNLPQVQRAVVHARTLGPSATHNTNADTRQLVAYVLSETPAEQFDGAALRQTLSTQLPAHMLPVAVVRLDAFPLSANGKLDRNALPEPDSVTHAGRAARPGLETQLASVFAQLLELPRVHAEDDFFALGGHSLLAMRLAAELRKQLQRPVSVGQIMAAPTVAKLAQQLQAHTTDASSAGFGERLYLRAGPGSPLFCIHPASGFAWQYSGLARYLPQDIALIGLQSPRPQGAIAASADLAAACAQHLASIRHLQPQGPYYLLGYSLGGTLAHAIAARLCAEGESVAFLGLLDTYPPEGQDWSGPTEDEARQEVAREREQFIHATEAVDDQELLAEKQAMFEQIVANYQDAVRLLAQGGTPYCAASALLFIAKRTLPADMDVQQTWRPYLANLRTVELECAHEDILNPQSLPYLGPLLAQALHAVR